MRRLPEHLTSLRCPQRLQGSECRIRLPDSHQEMSSPDLQSPQPVGKRFVEGFDGFDTRVVRDGEERAEGMGEIAEVFLLPVKEASENFHGQRLAGGEDGGEHGADVPSEFFQVGKLPLKPLEKRFAESLWKSFWVVQRKMAAPNVVAETFEVEEHTLALFKDLPDHMPNVGTTRDLRREFVEDVFTEVCEVGLGAGVQNERVQALQRCRDSAFGSAGDHDANPFRQALGVACEHLYQRVAFGLASLVKRERPARHIRVQGDAEGNPAYI